jgi:hypothetical protein
MFSEVDDDVYNEESKHKWHIFKSKSGGYYTTRLKQINKTRRRLLLHRVILGLNFGDGNRVDHIDGNGLNNQRSNLRLCTHSQNLMNQKKTKGKSKYKGVTWHKKRNLWMASIKKDKNTHYLGYFSEEIDAAKAYDKAAKVLFGEFAKTNF